MKISKLARRDAKQLFQTCMVKGVLDEPRVRQAVTRVITQKPRGYVPILSHFQRLVRLEVQRRTARVESAMPLDPALQAEVQGNLGRLYGAGLDLTFGVNPGLIGGIRVKVGSDVFDGSVLARLAALRGNF